MKSVTFKVVAAAVVAIMVSVASLSLAQDHRQGGAALSVTRSAAGAEPGHRWDTGWGTEGRPPTPA